MKTVALLLILVLAPLSAEDFSHPSGDSGLYNATIDKYPDIGSQGLIAVCGYESGDTRCCFYFFVTTAGIHVTKHDLGYVREKGRTTVTNHEYSGFVAWEKVNVDDLAPSNRLLGGGISLAPANSLVPVSKKAWLRVDYFSEVDPVKLVSTTNITKSKDAAAAMYALVADIKRNPAKFAAMTPATRPVKKAVALAETPQTKLPAQDLEEALRKLKDLFDKGLIDKSVYDAKAKELLNRL
jgi:hypothetical protein